MNIPSQSILAEAPSGLTRVVFLNDSDPIGAGLDGSHKINVKLNGKAVGSISINEYAQIFLEPEIYDLHMAHFDILTFKSDYKLNIGKEDVYIIIYSLPTSNAYEIVNRLPSDFREKYKPFNRKD
jgi:hypothetical protein